VIYIPECQSRTTFRDEVIKRSLKSFNRYCSFVSIRFGLPESTRPKPDVTIDITIRHLTNPAKDAWQVIGCSHLTSLPKDCSQVAGYAEGLISAVLVGRQAHHERSNAQSAFKLRCLPDQMVAATHNPVIYEN